MRLRQCSDHEALDGHALVDPLYHRQAEIAAHQSGDHDLAAARDRGDRKCHRLLVAGKIDDLVESATEIFCWTIACAKASPIMPTPPRPISKRLRCRGRSTRRFSAP